MPLWGSVDNTANSVISAVQQVNKSVSTTNRDELFGNTTVGKYDNNYAMGQFGISTLERTSGNVAMDGHAGWVLRKVGTGGIVSIAINSGGTGINAAGYIDFTGANTGSPNVSFTIANSQNVLEAYSTNSTLNVVNTVTLVTAGQGFIAKPGYSTNGDTTTEPTFNIVMGDRTGRVQYETLVAHGSMTSDAGDDALFIDYVINILTQPSSNSIGTGNSVNLTVEATSTPLGATLSYQWQRSWNGSDQTGPWIDVDAGDETIAITGDNTSTSLHIANNANLTANIFRVTIDTGDATQVISSNATITIV
jgi:hypothetical protein